MLIPISGLAFFIFIWKGLTPPVMKVHTAHELNLDAPIFVISLLGLYGVFFFFWELTILKNIRIKSGTILACICIAFLILLLHPVSNEYPVLNKAIGDSGGSVWLFASYLPSMFGNSIVYLLFFPLGCLVLYSIVRYLVLKGYFLIPICYLLWTGISLINIRTYQKYYEPFTIFFLGYIFTAIKTKKKWYEWIGPGLLLVLFIGIDYVRYYK